MLYLCYDITHLKKACNVNIYCMCRVCDNFNNNNKSIDFFWLTVSSKTFNKLSSINKECKQLLLTTINNRLYRLLVAL